VISPIKNSSFSPVKMQRNRSKRDDGRSGAKIFTFSSDKRLFSEEKKERFPLMMSQEEIKN